MHVATKASGDRLKVQTVLEYVRKTFNLANDKFHKEDPDFFSVLTCDKSWYKGLLREITVEMYHMSTAAGEAPAVQAQAIYCHHREEMVQQLRLHGSPESLRRALVINLVGAAAGRPGEVDPLSPDTLIWDSLFKCLYVMWPQMKTFKCKLVLFIAGANRFLCVINAFACAFAAGCFARHTYNPDEANHFFPSLADASSTSTVISNWIKNLCMGSNNREYQGFRAAGLPGEPSASGMRVGCINEMAAKGVCAEFTLAVSGHDAEKISTLWHYISVTLAALIPGARVLAGWAAPPYGQLGAGPTTASFGAIADTGVAMTRLCELTDRMLHLEPGLAPPAMLDGGELRPFSLAMGATLVMNYEESSNAVEVRIVTGRMREAMIAARFATTEGVAHQLLCEWGRLIKQQFNADNLPITASGSADASGAEATVAVVQQLAATVQHSTAAINRALQTQAAAVAVLSAKMENMNGRLAQLSRSTTSLRSPSASSTRLSPEDDRAATAFAATAADDAASAEPKATVLTSPTPIAAPPKSALESLVYHPGASSRHVVSLKGMMASEFYEKCLANGGHMPNLAAADISRGATVIAIFKAAATAGDTEAFSTGIAKSVRDAVARTHDRVIGRLLLAYVDLEEEAGKPLKTWKELTVNSLSDRLEELDKKASKPKGHKFYRMLLAEIVPQKDAARLDELVASKPNKDNARKNKPQPKPPSKKAKF